MFVCLLPCLRHLTLFISLCPLLDLLVFHIHLIIHILMELINSTGDIPVQCPSGFSSLFFHISLLNFYKCAFLFFLHSSHRSSFIALFLSYPFFSIYPTPHLPIPYLPSVSYFYIFSLICLWLRSIQSLFFTCSVLGCV